MNMSGMVIGGGVLSALALGWWATSGDGGESAIDLNRTVEVKRADVIDAVTASGRVEPLARVAVMSRASGIIQSLAVEEGDVVKDGDVLAQLDREQLEAQLAQDRANLASAKARLAAANARLEEARGNLEDPAVEYAERRARRMEELFTDDSVSENERDNAAEQLATAQFRLTQIRNSLPVLTAAVEEAKANFDSSTAALDRTQTSLAETTIRCSMDGVVLVRSKEVGDGVSSILTAGGNATEIMSLGDLSEMYIEARVDEVDLGRIEDGMPVLVTVDAYRSIVLQGQVERIAPAGSVDNNGIVTFEVRITVEDSGGILKPDMTADARLVIARRDQVLTLPQRAIQRDGQGKAFVRRVIGQPPELTVEEVPVEVGVSDGLSTEITGELSEGDRVMVPEISLGGRGR